MTADLRNTFRDRVAQFNLDESSDVSLWHNAVRSALRTVFSYERVCAQWDPWVALYLKAPTGQKLRVGTDPPIDAMIHTPSMQLPRVFNQSTDFTEVGTDHAMDILETHLEASRATARVVLDRDSWLYNGPAGRGVYLHLEDQGPEVGTDWPEGVTSYVIEERVICLATRCSLGRMGGIFIPESSGFVMLWREGFASGVHPFPHAQLCVSMISTVPSEIMLIPYAPERQKLSIGDTCPTCGEEWRERALFNSTFVGCMC